MFRRETYIALRARQEAHRVASDIAYPPAEADASLQPPQPVMPAIPWDDSPRVRTRRRLDWPRAAVFLCVIAAGLLAIYLMVMLGTEP